MMEVRYLFDASSIVKALKETKLILLSGQALQWLTVYEVLNAFWKETYLMHKLSLEEASFLVNIFTELLREMVVLEPKGLEQDILQIAVSKGITVYDASYIALAAKYDLILVTEDRRLFRTARNMINVANLDAV